MGCSLGLVPTVAYIGQRRESHVLKEGRYMVNCRYDEAAGVATLTEG
jgi:hypothetical protein